MAKPSIMIIDSDTYYGGIYASRFESAGWKVVVEEGVEGAKRRLKKARPNVVLVDLDPLEERLEFLQWIRQLPDADHLLLMSMTALGDRDRMIKAQSAGADSYLLKAHFVPSEAVKKVTRLMKEKNSL